MKVIEMEGLFLKGILIISKNAVDLQRETRKDVLMGLQELANSYKLWDPEYKTINLLGRLCLEKREPQLGPSCVGKVFS